MRRSVAHPFVVLVAAFGLTACGPKPAPAPPEPAENPPETGAAGPVEKPVPPLQLPVPAAPAEQLDNQNLKGMEAGQLLARANQAMAAEDYPRAAAFQYWYVQKSKTGHYNLACFLAQTGQIDPAFYWLQLAALEEGVDTQHARRDTDLTALRRDPRWGAVQKYLEACNRYFETASLDTPF